MEEPLKVSRFTLSVITMLVVVAFVSALSLLNDAPSASRYTPDPLPAQDDVLPDSSTEATSSDLTDPALREAEADTEGTPLDDSVRARQARSAQSQNQGGAEDGSTASGQGTSGSQTSVPKPVVPVSLTIEQRKAFYWEIIEAQDRAVAEADAQYPMDADPPQVAEYVALWLKLTEEYEAEVRRKYGLTPEQADAVIEEGIVNRWPMPPLPS